MQIIAIRSVALLPLVLNLAAQTCLAWVIDTQEQWETAIREREGFTLSQGLAVPSTDSQPPHVLRSVVRQFPEKRRASSLVIQQSVQWENWDRVKSFKPEGAGNAPIFLPIAENDYWFFGRMGRKYRAWHSSDLKNWALHEDPIPSSWATTAEYANGKIFLYYDQPNDQDPHLVIGELVDGQLVWTEKGMVFNDPTHGSDAGVIRTTDGVFHLIYEDYSPIDAYAHSWDSPLAGHVDSPDGVNGFQYGELPPAVDERTNPTGKTGVMTHPGRKWEYEIHEPEQDAFGDYTLIQVGERFYLFGDYHPAGGEIKVGYLVSNSINETFQFVGSFGNGHPDPTIGFTGEAFYLVTQIGTWQSAGPWIGKVTVRAGADIDGDGAIDQWTEWAEVAEQYHKKPGFARIVEVIPATLDLQELPAAHGFTFELRCQHSIKSAVPILDRVEWKFR